MELWKERGLAIAESDTVKKIKLGWQVPSQSGNGNYIVNMDNGEPFCTCQHFETTHKKCQHIYAVEFIAINVPMSLSSIHQYIVDWEALSEGEEGVTVRIDSDGDGDFEETIVTSRPNMPSGPSPENHATGVAINADLTWIGGDPDAGDTVTYDVYFGTSSTPPLNATIGPYPATQSSLTYDPGTLVDGMMYYWQVVARDNHGITRAGPVWEFRTSGVSPDEPAPEAGFASIVDKLVIVYYYAGSGVWDVYWPEFGIDTIGAMEVGEIYQVYVESDYTLEYSTWSKDLDGPDWNFVYWLGS